MELGIKRIWIFDGIPREEKKRELRKRREQKNVAGQKLDEAKDLA